MQELFRWNELADQPHNVASRRQRFLAHWRHAGSYFSLAATNLSLAWSVWRHYNGLKKSLYSEARLINGALGVAVSPDARKEETLAALKELGVRNVLVRVPSWEKERLSYYEAFVRNLREEGWEVLVALLQNRYDLLSPTTWRQFLEASFSRLGSWTAYFEVGHAWNRTKWGVWSYQEYLSLARPALDLATLYGIKLVGPAVIDFEFHLYPVTLKAIPFDVVSSLLYVDRTGAPEKAQWGWTLEKKVRLLRAVIESTRCRQKPCWITEFNWPLRGMEPYSPAPGRPCVSEEEQANYLVRYFLISLTSGAVERVYWWQLAARGYGLADPFSSPWHRRPAFYALKTLVSFVEGSTFLRRELVDNAWITYFSRGGKKFAVVWTKQGDVEHAFPWRIKEVFDRDGSPIGFNPERIIIQPRPKYVFFEEPSF